MNTSTLCLAAASLLLLAACATPEAVAPAASAKPAASPVPRPAPAPAAQLIEKVKALPQPERVEAPSREAAKVAADLVSGAAGNYDYKQSDTTGFPEALLSLQPGKAKPNFVVPANYSGIPTRGLTADGYTVDLIERDWSGIILTPVLAQVSKAYISGVQLTNIEVHPLEDGRVRIWVRVRNQLPGNQSAEVACSFKQETQQESAGTPFYQLQIPSGGFRDVFFVSPGGDTVNYTVLVRRSNRT